MGKIGKREKIILAIMGIVVLYGIYAFFFESSSVRSKAVSGSSHKEEMARIDTLLSTVAVALKGTKISSVDAYIIDQAQKPWSNDPFYVGPAPEQKGPDSATPTFAYTGYVELGEERLAIINGVDYRVGDPLEIPGFMLLTVAPSKVIIEDKEGQRKITVPFVEE